MGNKDEMKKKLWDELLNAIFLKMIDVYMG